MNINFNELLKIGQEKEQEARTLIKCIYNLDTIEICNDEKFDFMTSDNSTYEVKFDRKAEITGNFFIEYETFYCNIPKLKPSGISTTQAKNYILVYNKMGALFFVLLETSKLKELIRNKNYKVGECFNMKNNSSSKGYIIPVSDVEKVSTVYIKTDEETYYKI